MTAEFESMAGLLLVILTILCMVQLVFLGLLLWYLKKMADSLRGMVKARAPPPEVPIAGVPAPDTGAGEEAAPVAPVAPPPAPAEPALPAVEVIGDSPDIQASIGRLAEKYRLKDAIIATPDGLVVVSLSPGSSEDAARFSDLHRRKRKPDVAGVTFLEILHRGEPMLAILKADRPLTRDELQGIDGDARKILNWWL